jgi:hypothetical protein
MAAARRGGRDAHVYTLDGRQKKTLHAALLSAFPRHAALERLVEFQLDAHLAVIAGDGPLGDVVFRLIEWAEAHGRLDALVNGAREANPQNPELIAFERMVVEARDTRPHDAALRQFAERVQLTSSEAGQNETGDAVPRRGRWPRSLRVALPVLAVVAVVLAMPIWRPSLPWTARPSGGRAPQVVPTPATQAAAPLRRPVREEVVPFTWVRIDGRGTCESDATHRRAMYRGESLGPWPVQDAARAREVQVVVAAPDVEIEDANIVTRDRREAATVSLPKRHLVRKWIFGEPVAAPVIILVCARVRPAVTPPPAPFRVNTWKEIS